MTDGRHAGGTLRGHPPAVAENALRFATRSRYAQPAMVDGDVGIVVAPGGRLTLALTFAITGDRITRVHILAGPDRLARLAIAPLSVPGPRPTA